LEQIAAADPAGIHTRSLIAEGAQNAEGNDEQDGPVAAKPDVPSRSKSDSAPVSAAKSAPAAVETGDAATRGEAAAAGADTSVLSEQLINSVVGECLSRTVSFIGAVASTTEDV
jgi:hypothetical protein